MSSDAAKRATAKYQREKMESISIRVKRSEGLYDQIKQAAAARGIKPAQFIKQALTTAVNPPTVNPTATGNNVLLIEYPPEKLYNERIQLLIDAGITSSVSEYVGSVLFNDLDSELNFNGVSLWRYEHGTIEPRHK